MKRSFKVISIVDLILLVFGFGLNVYGTTIGNEIQYVFNMVAIVAALFYCFVGYKKEGQSYFKIFALLLALKEAAAIVHMAIHETVPGFAIILILICYTCTLLIGASLNLGKTKSYTLVLVLLVCSIISLLYTLIANAYAIDIIYNLTRLLLVITLGIMVYAKYVDKEKRHTK